MREDARKTTFVSFSGVAGAHAARGGAVPDRRSARWRRSARRRRPASRAVRVRRRTKRCDRSSPSDRGRQRPARRRSPAAAARARLSRRRRRSLRCSDRRDRHGARRSLAATGRAFASARSPRSLLGPAAALGLSARLPGLITGPRDAFVVALYLGGFFGVVAWPHGPRRQPPRLLASQATIATDSRARGRRAARAAGGLVTVLLPRLSHVVVADTSCRPRVVVAALDAFGTGRSPSRSASCWAMRFTSRRSRSCSRRSAATPDVAGAVAARRRARSTSPAAAIVVRRARRCSSPGRSTRSAGTPGGPDHRPLTVVRPDCACASSRSTASTPRIRTLAASGRVPALARALGGAHACGCSRARTTLGDPARVWTTVATGQPPEVHGVQGLETRRRCRRPGQRRRRREPSPLGRAIRAATDLVRLTRPAIASGSERRAKTFWEVAAEAGLRTAVVNWWATWPAPPGAGIVLSDAPCCGSSAAGALDAEIAPAGSLRLAARAMAAPSRQRARQAQVSVRSRRRPTSRRAPILRSPPSSTRSISLCCSRVVTPQTDLAVVYLPGLDIAQHALLGDSWTGAPPGAIDALDAARGAQTATTQRFGQSARAAAATGRGRNRRRRHRAGTRRRRRGRASVDDRVRPTVSPVASQPGSSTAVAPTVLYALGVPMGRDLAKRAAGRSLRRAVPRALPRAIRRDLRCPVRGAAESRRASHSTRR